MPTTQTRKYVLMLFCLCLGWHLSRGQQNRWFLNSRGSIVGLGEFTHGTAESYHNRIKLIDQYLAGSDSLVIAVEMPSHCTIPINRFLRGECSYESVKASLLFFGLLTNEFKEAISAAREQYKKGKYIFIFGMDVPYYKDNAVYLTNAVVNAGRCGHTRVTRRLSNMDLDACLPGNRALYDSLKKEMYEMEACLNQEMSGPAPRTEKEDILYAVENIKQSIDYIYLSGTANANQSAIRDSMMADNVMHTYDSLRLTTMIWAHNFHISRGKDRLGFFLDKRYGKGYIPMMEQSFEGSLLAKRENVLGAWRFVNDRGIGKWLNRHFQKDTTLLFKDTAAHIFNKIDKKMWVHYVGAEVEDKAILNYFYFNPAAYFDGIIYHQKSTASTVLPR